MTDTVTSREDFLRSIDSTDSDSMDFAVNRSDETDPTKTFSADALRQAIDSIGIFIATRISKRFKRGDKGPTQMVIRVRVQLDGETVYVPDEVYPWYVVNGPARLSAEDQALVAFGQLDDDARLRVVRRLNAGLHIVGREPATTPDGTTEVLDDYQHRGQ